MKKKMRRMRRTKMLLLEQFVSKTIKRRSRWN